MITTRPYRRTRPLSRSVRRRYALRGLPVPDSSTGVQVHIELREASGISQSFLILPNEQTSAVLSGLVDKAGGFQRIMVPVNIRATIV